MKITDNHEHTKRFGEPQDPEFFSKNVKIARLESDVFALRLSRDWYKSFFDKINDMYPDETAETMEALEK